MLAKKLQFLKFLITALIFLPSFCFANCPPTTIGQIETYLNKLDKVALKFNQTSPEGKENSGILLIKKPYNFRVNYDAPHPLVMTGGKNYVSIYDYELIELSRISAKENIFKFLLENNVNLPKTVKINSCFQDQDFITLNVQHQETEQQATIEFNAKPLSLKAMLIPSDGQDISKGATLIEFNEQITVRNIPDSFFTLQDPNIYGPAKRYSSEELLKVIK